MEMEGKEGNGWKWLGESSGLEVHRVMILTDNSES